MLEYARWKYILVAVVLLVALLFALPNVFGDDRALQMTRKDRLPIAEAELTSIKKTLDAGGIKYSRIAIEGDNVVVRFVDDATQLLARDFVKDEKNGLTRTYGSRVRGKGETAGLPIVELQSDSYKHRMYGKIYFPLLHVVGWTDPSGKPLPLGQDLDDDLPGDLTGRAA
jgi:hypothetical protein